MLEIDVPGHASSWQYGEPDLMADCIQKYTNVNSKYSLAFRIAVIHRCLMFWNRLCFGPDPGPNIRSAH
jgi:hypothetical protein